ncbi:ASXH domain-containing protein [Dichotomopilus funicola]|uniref:Asx homology domain-containing protein n=1 Tax=Dichotomopilus funicola TaxID=1934379 RepID=A0AAN6V3H6_9PEZI|nr:Asx homology domain-containing protein [Dichotomopilus funicola]
MADTAWSRSPSPASEIIVNSGHDTLAGTHNEPFNSSSSPNQQELTTQAPEAVTKNSETMARPSKGKAKGKGKGKATEITPPRDSDEGGQSSPRKRKATTKAKSAPPKKLRLSAQDKKWVTPAVFTDPKSPITGVDLRAILLHPLAWDVLSPEDHQGILAKFPDSSRIKDAGTENACPNVISLRNDDTFRYDCARYCENIQLGRHDPEWLWQAWEAHEKHKRGDYDGFLRGKFEEQWDIKLPEPEAKPEPEAEPELEDSGVAKGTEDVKKSDTATVSDYVENTGMAASSVAGDDLPKSLEAESNKPDEAPQLKEEEFSADGSADKGRSPPATENVTGTTNNNDDVKKSDNKGTSKSNTKIRLKLKSKSPSEDPSDSITCAANSLPAAQEQTPTISAGKIQSD